ncbi:MAG: 6,7-dimethyl-8-ribityllumazine synthase [Alphaproteobacteria bacterium]
MSDAPHIMIVEAPYYTDISEELAKGAIAVLENAGATHERVPVPGAFEIPSAIQMAVRSLDFYNARKRYDGYVALGCVIRGETSHYDIVCEQTARGVQDLTLKYTLAIGFGLLTVENRDQAWVRASREQGDKGGEAARACLRMIELKRDFRLYPR